MDDDITLIRALLCLERSAYDDFNNRMNRFESNERTFLPRSYPGYPKVSLPSRRRLRKASLERAIDGRRSGRSFAAVPPLQKAAELFRAHRVTGESGRGAVPIAGGFPSLELYLLNCFDSELRSGSYHYDRVAHELSFLVEGLRFETLKASVPSTAQLSGNYWIGVIAGDLRPLTEKYGSRGILYLAEQAGGLQQLLALTAVGEGIAMTSLGGYFEEELSEILQLPEPDAVLSVFAFGIPS